MDRLKKIIEAIRLFFDEVIGEMKKSTWPEKQELVESTAVVIVSLLLLAAFVGVADMVLVKVFTWLFKISSSG